MKRILCYGDSNTWGFDSRRTKEAGYVIRFPEHVRWTSIAADALGSDYCILEEGLNSRTTVFDDPLEYGKNGLKYIEIAVRTCDPIDCVIIMLGTNDLKDYFCASEEMITRGASDLVHTCRATLEQTQSAHARIILAVPIIPTADGDGTYWYGFSPESTQKGTALRTSYQQLAEQIGIGFFDANCYATADADDGVHLSEAGHRKLGEAFASFLRKVLDEL